MALQCGIVGLPNVGKSTLFNALTNAKAQAANFPFCTIEPNVGVITVPDTRLNKLEELVNPQKVLPTTIEIVDIAGLVEGASKGEGLGNQFLANIREVDAIIHVLRSFEDDNITHVCDSVDPIRDKFIIDTELQFKDMESLENAVTKAKKAAKTGDKVAAKEQETFEKVLAHLEEGKSVRTMELNEDQLAIVKHLHLLTIKPVMYVCNVDEGSVVDGNDFVNKVKEEVKDENAEVLIISAAIEADIISLDSYEDRQEFLEDLGLTESGLNKLVRSAYSLLDLITYFTAGEKEVRAWTVLKASTAPQAAGVIHTDFEKGFIKAEVIAYDDYAELGSETACKDAGKLRLEGKEYVVLDGDVMHFKFNV